MEKEPKDAGGRRRGELRSPMTAFPQAPITGVIPWGRQGISGAQNLSGGLRFPPGPLGPGFPKIAFGAIQILRLALPNQRYWCWIRRRGDPCGRPKAFPLGGRCRANARRMRGQVATHFVGRLSAARFGKLPPSLRRGAMRPPVEVSAPCRAREGELPCKGKRDRPEPRLSAPRTSAGRPVSGPYEKGGTASVYAVGAAHRAARPAFPLPGGRCPSAHTGADEGDPVEGKSAEGREKPPWGVSPPLYL